MNVRRIVAVLLLPVVLFASRSTIAAGMSLSFSATPPWEAVVEGKVLLGAQKYFFVVDDWDKCVIAVYSPGVKIEQSFTGRQKIASKPLATFNGGCVFTSDLASESKIQIIGNTRGDVAVLLFETPDYKQRKTRSIMVLLKKKKP